MAVGLLRLPVRLLVLVAALLACGQAAAQCPYPANVRCDRLAGDKMILGDLNDDGLVITDWTTGDPADALDDLFIFEQCVIGLPLCPLATYPNISGDFNFDGVIDNIDREYLQQLGRLADPVTNVGRIPKINLSEFRSGKPQSQTAPGVSSSRYVEFVNWKFDSASTPA